MCQKESQLGMIKQRKEKQTKVGECDISGWSRPLYGQLKK